MNDRVNHPEHYTWLKDKVGIEPIKICELFNFNIGNAFKYLFRAGHKTEEGYDIKQKEIEDLEKAVYYIQEEIHKLKDTNYDHNTNE